MQGGHNKMSEESSKINVQTRIGHFARYINKYGRRNQYTRLGIDGVRRTFSDGEWIEIPEADARWYESQSKDNVTWEYKTDTVVLETTHNYVRFTGLNGKTVAEIPQYDKDERGDVILNTRRDYTLPKDVWVYCNPKDAAYFKRMAGVNTFIEFEDIVLPTTVNAPIKFVKTKPSQYAIDVYDDLRDKGALKFGSILYDKVGEPPKQKVVKKVVKKVAKKKKVKTKPTKKIKKKIIKEDKE